jgi:MFS family permease
MSGQKERDFPVNEPGFFYGYVIVVVAFMIMVVFWGAFYSFGVFFKPIVNEFRWTRAMTSGAFSLTSIISGSLGIAMGGLTDKYGPRIVMTLCGLFLGLGYLLMSQLSAIWQLYLFYGTIVGIGMGGSFVPLMSTVARWFIGKRSTMSGIVVAGIGIGAFIGPPIASRLIACYGWRASYVILCCTLLTVVLLCAQFIRRDPTQMGKVPYGVDGGAGKVLKQGTREYTLREAVYTAQFWIVFVIFISLGFCVYAIMVHIAPHATELGISAIRAASILATIGGSSIVGKVVLGRAADKIGSRITLLIGFILLSAALFLASPANGEMILFLFAAVFGFAYGGCVTSESPLVAELFGLKSHGVILGVIAFSFTIGGAGGPLLVGYIFDVSGSYQFGLLVCAVISLNGLVLTAILKRRRV